VIYDCPWCNDTGYLGGTPGVVVPNGTGRRCPNRCWTQEDYEAVAEEAEYQRERYED
jgi:hypothetical protein